MVVLPMHELVVVKSARRKPNQRLVALLEGLANASRIDGLLVAPRGTRSDLASPLAVVSVRHAPLSHARDDLTIPVFTMRASRVGVVPLSVADRLDVPARELVASIQSIVRSLEATTESRGRPSRRKTGKRVSEREPARTATLDFESVGQAQSGESFDLPLKRVEELSDENRRLKSTSNAAETRQELFNVAVQHLLEGLDAAKAQHPGVSPT